MVLGCGYARLRVGHVRFSGVVVRLWVRNVRVVGWKFEAMGLKIHSWLFEIRGSGLEMLALWVGN